MKLKEQVVVVTGGANGIGREYCVHLADEGARLVIADIDVAGANALAAELNAAGAGRALALGTDVTSEADTQAMAHAAVEAFGRIDVLVNNAGMYPHVDFPDISYEHWRQVMTLNLDSVFLCSRAVLPIMKAQQRGKIINIATNLVWIGLASMVHYVASKAGVVGFTRALAREVGPFGITVNALAPGAVIPSPDRLDAAALARVEAIVSHQSVQWCQRALDVVGPLLFLASADSDFMSGQILTVDGGLTNH